MTLAAGLLGDHAPFHRLQPYDITVNVDRKDMLDLMAATDIFTADGPWSAGEALALRREFTEGYVALTGRIPERLGRLRRSLVRHVSVLRRLGLRTRDLRPGREPSAAGLGLRALAALPMLALAAHPIVSYLAMTALERLERFRRRLRVFRLAARPARLERLRRHQQVIQRELQALVQIHRKENQAGA